jgi:hypothetical protein
MTLALDLFRSTFTVYNRVSFLIVYLNVDYSRLKLHSNFRQMHIGKNAKIINSQQSNRLFEKLRDTRSSFDVRPSTYFGDYDGI